MTSTSASTRSTRPSPSSSPSSLGPRLGLALVLGLVLVSPAAAQRGEEKLDQHLREHLAAGDTASTRTIVTLRAGAKSRAVGRLRARGASVTRDHDIVDALSVTVSASQLDALASDPDVLSVSTDAPVYSSGVATHVSGQAADSTYSLRRVLGIDGPRGASQLIGRNITVVVIDSGILPTPDFAGRLVASVDFVNPDGTGRDAYGHGTHIGGIIGGRSSVAGGIAPGVRLISLRVLDDNGVGTTSAVIAALQWVRANRRAHSIDLVNLSLGHPIYEPAATDPLVQAVEATVRAGVVVVASAGNLGLKPSTGQPGYAGIVSPGNAPSAITVGAVKTFDTNRRTDDLVPDYSSRGPTWYDAMAKPDVVATGHRVMAASDPSLSLYRRYPELHGPTIGRREYLRLSGTSMAAATVTGTVALMLEASLRRFHVKPHPRTIKAMLQFSAFPMADAAGVRYDTLTQGAGAVSAGAVKLAAVIDPRIPMGHYWLTRPIQETTTVDGQVIGWGENIVWGDGENIVWGDGENIVWGDGENIVWGDGENIVWGDGENIVWGDGENIVWGD